MSTDPVPALAIASHALPGLGSAYAPAGRGPFPAVLVLHGSEGAWAGWSHRNAVLLAAHGFLALPFGYSAGGNPWNAGSIHEVPLDRTADALTALRASTLAGPGLGIYAVSRGAEHALLLTALMAAEALSGALSGTLAGALPGLPDAVAVHAPADVVCGAFHAARWRDRGDPGWQAWDPADRAWTWRGRSDGPLLPSTPIGIDAYSGPLFLSHGADDPVWTAEMTRRLEGRLRAAGRSPEVHVYPGQGHLPAAGEAETAHFAQVIAFLRRHLAG